MTTILRIDSSSRVEGSHSRDLADFFQQTWQQKYPDDRFIVRDVTQPAIPHLENLAIAGFQTPSERQHPEMAAAISISNTLIAELKQADILLISAPMYNFSIPSAMKAWIDQIVREGETFSVDATGYKGLLTTERAFVVSATGASGYSNGGPLAELNFVEPYFQGLLGFLGVKEIQYFCAEGMAEPDRKQANLARVKENIKAAIG